MTLIVDYLTVELLIRLQEGSGGARDEGEQEQQRPLQQPGGRRGGRGCL